MCLKRLWVKLILSMYIYEMQSGDIHPQTMHGTQNTVVSHDMNSN